MNLLSNRNIWTGWPAHYVVVPTNIGWKKCGSNVMGRGIARQAAKRLPELPAWYGEYCRARGEDATVVVHPSSSLVLFPTKPLNVEAPYLSWRGGSTLERVEKSLAELSALDFDKPVYIPTVGCGNGGLLRDDVAPLMAKYLDNRFTWVTVQDVK